MITRHLVTTSSLSTESAIAIVLRSIELSAAQGFAVAATVLDRSGTVLAAARANDAGPGTLDGSRRKAFTALNMRMSSKDVEKLARENVELRALGDIAGFLPLQGGVLIRCGEEIVGAVGIGGASGEVDESSAATAIAQVLSER